MSAANKGIPATALLAILCCVGPTIEQHRGAEGLREAAQDSNFRQGAGLDYQLIVEGQILGIHDFGLQLALPLGMK